MNAKKMFIQLLIGAGLLFANVLWGLPGRSVQSSSSPQLENLIFLPIVQRASLLPNSLYFIQNGQIYRMERDGVTITQITFEPESVLDFDISPLTGKMAYSLAQQLILADANGANREVLVVSESDVWFYPHWSPDGQMLAYMQDGGLYFFFLEAEISNLVLSGDNATYIPGDFSPNGLYLVVSVRGNPTGMKKGIYNLASGTVSIIAPAEPSWFAPWISQSSWSPASNYLYIFSYVVGGSGEGLSIPGLWRYTTDGTGINLLPMIDEDGSIIPNKVTALWQEPDGDLMYLFSPPETGFSPNPPFSLVHTASDGITNRVNLRPEAFFIGYQSLWSPDGSALVLIQGNGENMILIPVNSSSPVITLLEDASGLWLPLHWGP